MGLSHIGQIVGHGAKAMIARAFELDSAPLSEELHEAIFAAFLEDYVDNLANETHLFDGLLKAMNDLSHEGYDFAVCTNKKHSMAVPLLEQLGVVKHFKSITGGDSFDFRKPDPRHLEETAKLAGHALENAIMIGDSETDINAALNASIPSVAVTFGYSGVPVDQLGATKLIDQYSELPQTIREIVSEAE